MSDLFGNILRGECSTADRSEALTLAVREWYGWANWCRDNGVRVQGSPEDLADYAGTQLGIDRDRLVAPHGCQALLPSGAD